MGSAASSVASLSNKQVRNRAVGMSRFRDGGCCWVLCSCSCWSGAGSLARTRYKPFLIISSAHCADAAISPFSTLGTVAPFVPHSAPASAPLPFLQSSDILLQLGDAGAAPPYPSTVLAPPIRSIGHEHCDLPHRPIAWLVGRLAVTGRQKRKVVLPAVVFSCSVILAPIPASSLLARPRISGWLLYDFEHTGAIGTQRATVWEVHPITKIAVKQNNTWVDLDQ
jgi:hypothetical protein